MKTLHIGRLYIDVGRINREDNGGAVFYYRPRKIGSAWFALRGIGASIAWVNS